MPCFVDPNVSRAFQRKLKQLRKDFPSLDNDLAGVYEEIKKDYKRVPQSHAVPGYQNVVWKYRCESSDMERGKSGSFRLLAYYKEADNTVYPFFVYSKKEYEKYRGEQPRGKEINEWIEGLKQDLATPEILEVEYGDEDVPTPEHTCPNCGPSVALRNISAEFEILLECPDCQRAYRIELEADGTMRLVPS